MDNETRTRIPISADWVLKRIQEGKDVRLKNAVIKGDLDLRKLNLTQLKDGPHVLVTSSIEIRNTIFDGSVNFRKAIFEKLIILDRNQFNDIIDISFSQFNEIAHFTKSLFNGEALFLGSHFGRFVYFDESQFSGISEFGASHFGADVHFTRTRFFKGVIFNGSRFEGKAFFLASKFDDDTFFDDITFNDYAEFSRCLFGGYIEFKKSSFCRDASFAASKFSDRANFESASFSGRLILNSSEIHSMNLDARFDEGSSISLKHSEYYRLEANWANIKDKIEYDGSAYLALVKNYNRLEWFSDADNCYYQYRKRRRSSLKIKEKMVDIIPWMVYGYGVRPEIPILWLTLLFLFSACVYSYGGQTQTFLNASELSIVFLTTTTQIGSLAGFHRWWSISERVLGWLLMSTFLVTLAKKMLK